jgi:hypothetical protein
MKRYEILDWELLQGSPVKRIYGRSRHDYLKWLPPLRRRISLEWNGVNRLTARAWHLWPRRQSWSTDELGGISFGIREQIDRPPTSPPVHRGWFWYVHLTGKHLSGVARAPVLAEFMVGHQHDRPATDVGRASVPPLVKDLVNWLEACTEHRAHGPVLISDKGRQDRK